MFKTLRTQSTISFVFLSIFLIIAVLAASWGITCLVVYWISLLWSGTVFAFDWSWGFATGVWLVLALLGVSANIRVNNNAE